MVSKPRSSGPSVIVVGAGVVGCSIAMHLAQAGAKQRVLDVRGRLAS